MKILTATLLCLASIAQAACSGWNAPFFSCPADSMEQSAQECYCQCDPDVEIPPALKEGSSLLEKLDYYMKYPWLDPGESFQIYSPHDLFVAGCSEFAVLNGHNPMAFELLMNSLPQLCDEDIGAFLWDYSLSLHNQDELGRGMALKALTAFEESHPGAGALLQKVEDSMERGVFDERSWTTMEKKEIYQIFGNIGDGSSAYFLKTRVEALSLTCEDGSSDAEERWIEEAIQRIRMRRDLVARP